MKQITINPNNEPYYSEDFIKGFKCGAQRQFEADKDNADRPQGEWIPCSERLPEKDGSYLVCWNYRNMDVLMWADGWNCIRRIDGKVDRNSEIDGANITAWMPLPEPYREDGEEE